MAGYFGIWFEPAQGEYNLKFPVSIIIFGIIHFICVDANASSRDVYRLKALSETETLQLEFNEFTTFQNPYIDVGYGRPDTICEHTHRHYVFSINTSDTMRVIIAEDTIWYPTFYDNGTSEGLCDVRYYDAIKSEDRYYLMYMFRNNLTLSIYDNMNDSQVFKSRVLVEGQYPVTFTDSHSSIYHQVLKSGTFYISENDPLPYILLQCHDGRESVWKFDGQKLRLILAK